MNSAHIRTTLAAEVSINRPEGNHRERDVVLSIQPLPRGRTGIDMFLGPKHVAITLSPAERVALIEALGGTAS